MRRIFPSALLTLVVLTLVLMELSVAPVFASDPPPGLPWGKGTPWPTAMPLRVGVPFSVNGNPPVVRQVQPLAIATKVRPAPLVVPAPVVPTPVPPPPVVAAPVVPTPVPPPPVVAAPVVPIAAPPPAPVVVPTAVPPAPVASATNSGSDISNALEPGDTMRTLGSGASVWFRVGSAASAGVHMDVWLDISTDSNVDLAVYAPNQLDNLSGPPAGRGTPFQNNRRRLHWTGGGSNAVYGIWYARITNNNPYSIDYKLTTENAAIAPKSCTSYWEWIGPNLVWWSACQ